MPKKIQIVIGIIFVTLIVANLSIMNSGANDSSIFDLNNLKIEAAYAQIEVPEVIILCNYNPPGHCWWEDCHNEWTPLGLTRVTYCPEWTGITTDICVENMPCW